MLIYVTYSEMMFHNIMLMLNNKYYNNVTHPYVKLYLKIKKLQIIAVKLIGR